MKKTLIALAALAATASFAQSTVTLYGVFDTGYQSSKATFPGLTLKQQAGVQGGMSGNRIGFKGTEDLGGSLKANFTVELGLDPTEANSAFGDNNRQSFVGLSGGFGSFNMGRQYSLHFNNQAAGDLLGNLNGLTGYLGSLDSLIRVSNSFIYTSPSFSGVTLGVEKALGETIQSSATANAKQNETSGARLSYANGPLAVGYAYEETKKGTFAGASFLGATALAGGAFDKREANNISASYDFGMAKVGWVNNSTKFKTAAATAKWTNNTLSASVPMGAATLFAGFSDGEVKQTGSKTDASGYQVGVSYALSKRTNAYVFNGQTKYKNTAATNKLTQTNIGVRHTF